MYAVKYIYVQRGEDGIVVKFFEKYNLAKPK